MTDLRRTAVVVAGLLISAFAIWFVLQSIDLAEAVAVLGRADPMPLLAILGVVAIQIVVRAWRWSILMPARPDGTRVSGFRLVPPLLVGYLGNAVLPARLGEPMRAVIASRRERIGTTEAIGSVLVERVIDVATLAPVAFVAALLVGAPDWTTLILGVAAGLGIAVVVVLTTIGVHPLLRVADRLGLRSRPRARSVAVRLADTIGGRSRRGALLAAVGISTGAWLMDSISFWLAAQSVGVELSYTGAVLIAGVTVLGTAVPSAPGYVGTFELAAATMAGALGVPGAPALAMAIVAHVLTLVPVALAGAISLVAMGARLGEVAHAAEIQRGG